MGTPGRHSHTAALAGAEQWPLRVRLVPPLCHIPQSSLSWRRSPARGVAPRFTQSPKHCTEGLTDQMKYLITQFINQFKYTQRSWGREGQVGRAYYLTPGTHRVHLSSLCHLGPSRCAFQDRVLSKEPWQTQGAQSNACLLRGSMAGRWPAEQVWFSRAFLG